MGLFDKASLSGALGKAKGFADKAAEAAKTGIDQTKRWRNPSRASSRKKAD